MADSNRLHSINTSRILRTIWLNPGISRIKVAELLDLDRSTVTKIMQVILDRGLVVTAGKNTEQSGVGRRQINLRINEDLGVVLGIEIQDTRYIAVVTTIAGKVLQTIDGVYKTTRDNMVGHILSIIARAKVFIAERKLFLLGIGIGFPGILDPYTGKIIRSNSLHVGEPFDIRSEIEAHCGEPVYIENDANCCCWGELAFQTENRNRNFLAVLGEFRDNIPGSDEYHGLAIGLGLVIRGRVLHGDHFTAGEFRSVLASPESGQFTISYNDMRSLPANPGLLRDIYRELTENLALLVNCIDFTKILFAGDIPAHRENLKEGMEKAIVMNSIYDLERKFIIEFAEHGHLAVCVGAAGLFVEKLFSVPDIADRFQELVGYDLYEQILNRKG
jgi:predicted NBD/HSP70 family sugar kinase